MKKYSADLGLLLVGFIWGTGFIVAKISLDEGINPYYMMFLRSIIAAIFLSCIFFKAFGELTKRELISGVFLGSILYLAFSFQTVGLAYTTASKNAFLTAINVVLVPYLYWIFYKKKPTISAVISALICLFGIGLLSLDDMNISLNKGDILTIISAVFFGCHITFTGILSKRLDAIRLNLIQICTMSVFAFLTCFFVSNIGINLSKVEFLAVLYLGVFSTGICFLLQTTCQQYTTPARASLFLCTESLFAPILSVLILHEVLTIKTLIGAGLIIISVLVSELKSKE